MPTQNNHIIINVGDLFRGCWGSEQFYARKDAYEKANPLSFSSSSSASQAKIGTKIIGKM